MPRDASDLLRPAVDQAIAALRLEDADVAAVRLARGYADTIDQARDPAWGYRWLGPELLRVLEQLGATPATRKPAEPPRGESQLDRLRAARASSPRHQGP